MTPNAMVNGVRGEALAKSEKNKITNLKEWEGQITFYKTEIKKEFAPLYNNILYYYGPLIHEEKEIKIEGKIITTRLLNYDDKSNLITLTFKGIGAPKFITIN